SCPTRAAGGCRPRSDPSTWSRSSARRPSAYRHSTALRASGQTLRLSSAHEATGGHAHRGKAAGMGMKGRGDRSERTTRVDGPADQHDHDGSTAVLNPPSDEMGFADETATAGHDERPSTEDLLDEISRLDSFLRALNDQHARRLSELEGEVQELRRRVSTLERDRLGAAPDRVGGSTVLHDEYRSIGQNVEGILTQYVLYLAEPSGAGRRRGQSDSLRAARAAREICEPLFAPGNADRQAFLAAVQAVVAPRDRERLDLAARWPTR